MHTRVHHKNSVGTTALLLGIVALASPPLLAQDTKGAAKERFKRVQDEIQNSDGNPELISEMELRAFLARKLPEILADVQGAGLVADPVSPDRLLDKLTALLMNAQVGKENGFSESSLPRLEAMTLSPLEVTFRSLLPKPPGTAPSKDPFSTFDKWFSMRKSFLDSKGIGSPATFTWSHYPADDDSLTTGDRRTVVAIEAALVLEPAEWEVADPFGIDGTLSPVFVIEANTSTQHKVGKDIVTHRLGAEWFAYGGDHDKWSHTTILAADYVTDRDYDAEVYGYTAQYTPDYAPWAIGEYATLVQDRLFMRWRPYVGLNYGSVSDDGDNATFKKMGTYTTAYAKLTTEFLFSSGLKLVPEWTESYEVQNAHDWHDHFAVGLRYPLDEKERISLELNYNKGQTGPDFTDQSRIAIGLGLKF